MPKRPVATSWGKQIDKDVLPDYANAMKCRFCHGEVTNPNGGIAYTEGFTTQPPDVSARFNAETRDFETLSYAIIWKCPKYQCGRHNWSHANYRCVEQLAELGIWPEEHMEDVPD